jgi:diguanylate cyclase
MLFSTFLHASQEKPLHLSVLTEAGKALAYPQRDALNNIKEYLLWSVLALLLLSLIISTVLYILFLKRKLKKSLELIEKMATHDPLTRLPNQRFFQEYAEKILESCRRRSCRMAIYFMDLDSFKPINENYGHEGGDLLLQEVAQRLNKLMRKSDFCARIGGDKFVTMIMDIEHDKGFDRVAHRILNELSHPYLINKRETIISVSIGISFYPEQGSDLEELLKKARKALYEAKEKGKGCYRIYHGD